MFPAPAGRMLLPLLRQLSYRALPVNCRTVIPSRCYCTASPVPKNQPRVMNFSSKLDEYDEAQIYRNRTVLNYMAAVVIFMGGAAFAFIPIFNAFCSYNDLATTDDATEARERMKNLTPVKDTTLFISFNADKSSYLNWKFQPLQSEIAVSPGETVLAFYSAENPSDKPISGVSTYNVVPYEAAKYLNKIQCFCFDEQRLNPHEQVDMPVFFYIDPDIMHDPHLYDMQNITLSYTFFEAIEGLDLPFMSSFVDED